MAAKCNAFQIRSAISIFIFHLNKKKNMDSLCVLFDFSQTQRTNFFFYALIILGHVLRSENLKLRICPDENNVTTCIQQCDSSFKPL